MERRENEGDVDHDSRRNWRARELLGAELAGVDLLEVGHARIAAELGVELARTTSTQTTSAAPAWTGAVGEARWRRRCRARRGAGERELD
jgi:hypothetical protein